MSKEKLLFNKTSSHQELVELIENELIHVGKSYFNHDAYEQAIASLHTFDEITKKRIVEFANYVDSNMNYASQANKNRFHKIPTILAGAIYLDLYPDKIEDLSLEELQILAKYSINLPLIFYKNATMYYNKELLSVIRQISPDYMYQTSYMYLAEKYLGKGQTPDEVTEYFKKTDPKQLLEESFEYEMKMISGIEGEILNDESRRI